MNIIQAITIYGIAQAALGSVAVLAHVSGWPIAAGVAVCLGAGMTISTGLLALRISRIP